jgi:hypothetical protein
MRALPEAALVKRFRVGVRSLPYLADHAVVAQLEIEPGAPARAPAAAFPTEGFQPLSSGFYARLRANRNQYGSQFQLLSSVGTRNGESLAKIRIAENRRPAAEVRVRSSIPRATTPKPQPSLRFPLVS